MRHANFGISEETYVVWILYVLFVMEKSLALSVRRYFFCFTVILYALRSK